MSTVGEIMTSDVLTVDPSDTIGETAQQMVERGVSSAVVSDYGTLIGIVTERDLTRAVAGRVHTSEARVREWMTSDPITLSPDASADEAAKIMLDNGFRHVPIVQDGRAVGIVSIRDVARWSTEDS
jgi:CBS domain-containing protein